MRRTPAPSPARGWLIAAGLLSTGIALLHLAIIAAGPRAYAYFGAPQLAPMAARGSPVPALMTAGLALLFAIWAWYAFAGAGLAARPPLLTLGLWVIGAVFTARGLVLIPELVALGRDSASVPPRFAVFSSVSLATGVAYLAGAWLRRRA